MSVRHFTYDRVGRIYTAHFGASAAREEIDAALWVIGGHSSLVKGATTAKVEGQWAVRFTLYPDRDPSRAFQKLCGVLLPQFPYTLQSLHITSTQEICGRHNATHIRALFWEGLVPPDVEDFAEQLTTGLLEPEGMGLQLRHDRRGIIQEATRLHEAARVFQQGETVVIFTKSQGACPTCSAATASHN